MSCITVTGTCSPRQALGSGLREDARENQLRGVTYRMSWILNVRGISGILTCGMCRCILRMGKYMCRGRKHDGVSHSLIFNQEYQCGYMEGLEKQ